jgi:hypothetical protein
MNSSAAPCSAAPCAATKKRIATSTGAAQGEETAPKKSPSGKALIGRD